MVDRLELEGTIGQQEYIERIRATLNQLVDIAGEHDTTILSLASDNMKLSARIDELEKDNSPKKVNRSKK